jgi:hypothetical protein
MLLYDVLVELYATVLLSYTVERSSFIGFATM